MPFSILPAPRYSPTRAACGVCFVSYCLALTSFLKLSLGDIEIKSEKTKV